MNRAGIQRAITIMLVFGFIGTKAQAPGYMGKKLCLSYGFYCNPAFAAAGFGYGTSILNRLHYLHVEYVTGKRAVFGLAGSIYKTTYENSGTVQVFNSNSSQFRQLDERPSGNYLLKCSNASAYVKLFKRDYLAPWGRYFIIGITRSNYTATYDPKEMRVLVKQQEYVPNQGYYDKYSYFSNFGNTTQSFQTADLMIGNGKSRIFANRIVVDYGYNLNVIATTLAVVDAFDEDFEITPDRYIERKSLIRVRGINRFNFFVKIGYLF